MKRISLLIAAGLLLQLPGFSQEQKLFNGKDLAGWAGAVDDYMVEDGAITCRPDKGGTLFTEEQYGDFAVRLELFFTELLRTYLENRDTIRILYREFEHLVPHGTDGVVGQLTKVNETISTFVRQGIERCIVADDVAEDGNGLPDPS